jgi:hypothetical protein
MVPVAYGQQRINSHTFVLTTNTLFYIPEAVDTLLMLVERPIHFLQDTEWQIPSSVPSSFELQQPSVASYRPIRKYESTPISFYITFSYPPTSAMLGVDV